MTNKDEMTAYLASTGLPPKDAPIGRKIGARGVPITAGAMWPDRIRGEPITAIVIRNGSLEDIGTYTVIPSVFSLCDPLRGIMEVEEWWNIIPPTGPHP